MGAETLAGKIKLNGLQTRTLALLQELASHEDFSSTDDATGDVTVHHLPHPHGDHMHVGRFAVSSRFASGLYNENVWVVLERKGMARSNFPLSITLTKQGLDFKTGIREKMLEDSDH